MSFERNHDDYTPITWVGQVPIYATTLLVALHVLTMVGTSIALAMAPSPVGFPSLVEASPILAPLLFSNVAVLEHLAVWQFFTYPFVNAPSIWFAIEMYLLFSFGREVERFLGRKGFLWLYLALMFAAPIALTVLGLAKVPVVFWGSSEIHFAIFIAFVVLYPGAQFFFSLQAKWVAAILLAIYSLQYLANQAWINLGVLWLECACAVLMLRFSGATNASLAAWLPEREERPVRRVRAPKAREPEPETDLHQSIDPLLEKISKHGIGSLTKRERLQLEQARAALLEREKGSH